jgi:hypothetical protein
MRTLILLTILIMLGMFYAFPSPSAIGPLWSETHPELAREARVAPAAVEPHAKIVVGESNWSKGGVTVYDNSGRQAQMIARLEHLRKLNAPPEAPGGIVIIVETNVTQEVTTDRRVHTRRERTARKGYTTELP